MAKEVLEMEVKSNIGDVSKGIDKAAKSTKKLAKETEKVEGATGNAKRGFRGLGMAVKGFGLALKAAGIGLVISAFVALKEAVSRNQTVMDGMNTILSTISITFNQVVDVVVSVAQWVGKSTDRFNGLAKVLNGVITIAFTSIKLQFYGWKFALQEVLLAWEKSPLGGGDLSKIEELRQNVQDTRQDLIDVGLAAVQAGKDIFYNIADAAGEIGDIYTKVSDGISTISIKANKELAESTVSATRSAMFAQAEFSKLNAQKLKEAEEQRQIRDDETKTFAERIEANKKLKVVLEEQQTLQRAQIQIGISAAALALQQNDNDENRLALMAAQNAEYELEETIVGQISEQKTNQVGLEKELAEAQKEIRAEGLVGLKQELQELEDAYALKLDLARKSAMDTTAITKQYEKQKSDLVKDNLNEQLSAYSGLAGALSGLAGDNKALAIAAAVMDTYAGANKAFAQAGPAGFATGAAIIAAGLANVQKIMAVDVGSGGGGGGSVGAAPQAPAPQMMSGAFDISGGVAPEATKAYVVTDEMSNSQNQLANIRRRATI